MIVLMSLREQLSEGDNMAMNYGLEAWLKSHLGEKTELLEPRYTASTSSESTQDRVDNIVVVNYDSHH